MPFNRNDVHRLYGRFRADERLMRVGANKLYALTMDRFSSQGASSGTPWPQKRVKQWGYDDGRAILTGPTGLLQKAWGTNWTDHEASCGNPLAYSLVHQLGTVGKGGQLPTIKPKKAKALFIPITDKAVNSARLEGQEGDFYRRMTKMTGFGEPANLRPVRFGVKFHGGTRTKPARSLSYVPLIKGRLKDGRLQRQDPKTGEWTDGVPDYLFLKKVDIAPRKMLPTAQNERADLVLTLIDFMRTRSVPRQ